MIELIKNKETNRINLLLDGVILDNVDVAKIGITIGDEDNNESKSFEIYDYFVNDKDSSETLAKQPLNEFPNLRQLKFKNWFSWTNFDNYIEINSYRDSFGESSINSKGITGDGTFFKGHINIIFSIVPNLENWNNNFNFADYCKEFLQNHKIQEQNYIPSSVELEFRNGSDFGVFYNIHYFFEENHSKVILEDICFFENFFRQCHLKSVNNLKSKIQNRSLDTFFNFPEQLRIPCEQYLLYFAQFLKDLGINAASNLKEEAGKVLFSVTPTDDVEALDKIREALAVYLNLPSSPIVYDDSFAAMRLQAEIERLQTSQRIAQMEFRVAQKALDSQDKIIHQQSVLLEQQAKVIEKITDKAVMINSAENKEELEKIYEGIEVGESKFLNEKLGIKFNPAKVVKTAVNNILGKGNEIIELGLDKE